MPLWGQWYIYICQSIIKDSQKFQAWKHFLRAFHIPWSTRTDTIQTYTQNCRCAFSIFSSLYALYCCQESEYSCSWNSIKEQKKNKHITRHIWINKRLSLINTRMQGGVLMTYILRNLWVFNQRLPEIEDFQKTSPSYSLKICIKNVWPMFRFLRPIYEVLVTWDYF